jgi:3-oxoadipate enol-lactonase
VKEVRVDTALGEIRLRVSGTGEAILFWPSLLMTGDMWSAQAEHFSDRYRVVLIDPPGHGGSERLTAAFTFEDCARCVVDILDGLGIDDAHFVGNSWGGMIGGTFAATYPDRVRRAVLMNCTASPAGARQKVEYGILLRIARWLGGIRPPLTRSVLKAFLGPTTFRTRPDVVAFVRATVQADDLDSCAWAVRSVRSARPDVPRDDAGAGRRGRRGRDVPQPGDQDDGRRDPRLDVRRARRRCSPRRLGAPRVGQSAGGRLPDALTHRHHPAFSAAVRKPSVPSST